MGSFYEAVNDGYDGEVINGYAMLLNWGKYPTRNGGSYVSGKLSTGEGIVDFKAWSDSQVFKDLQVEDTVLISGSVVSLSGKVSIYNGQKSVVLSGMMYLTPAQLEQLGFKPDDFQYSKYDLESYWTKFCNLMSKHLSSEALGIFNEVMGKYGDAFEIGFGAIYYHDACKGGLMAHSLKICQMATVVSLYPNILNRVSKDLLYLGCALHDLGKLVEYSNGAISGIGRRLCHTVVTPLMLSDFKDSIVSAKGEDFYYDLISIAANHHGESGEPPRTVAAYVVHMLDLLESRFQGLDEQIAGLANSSDQLQYDGFKLI